MVRQLIIGLVCEGSTDHRFLSSIIKRTYENVVLQYTTNVEILDIQSIFTKDKTFVDQVYGAVLEGTNNYGMLVLCLHSDADSNSDINTFKNKISPAIKNILAKEEDICKVITPIVPISMTEAWMLADEKCFLDEIGSELTMKELGINKKPELVNDPKTAISYAITKAFENRPMRRSKPVISELYVPIGQKCNLAELEKLSSYLKFKTAVKASLVELNYIQDE